MLDSLDRSSAYFWGNDMVLPEDCDDGYWLVNMKNEILGRVDSSFDDFLKQRKNEEDGGFQLVTGKKKKGGNQMVDRGGAETSGSSEVKVASGDFKNMGGRPKVPFHIATIRKPQEEYKILVNNVNQPFDHVWLQRSEDGSRFIHPLENYSPLNFVDKNISNIEPSKPPPVESTPYKLVEEVKDLKELAKKLRGVDEFAVDLEHNQYRSFQGLTCLMQISTRTDDFVVDTLKLRIHIGPHLREIFKDPAKKKVMHGADRDIIWLQRDFGIYVCNLFDTGQASRVLKLERNSLEYLLHHFCGVTANKEYQNADWRLRPLTHEMLRYAREDTHYLLHIYDLMRTRLLSSSALSDCFENPLVEVFQRSYDVCLQLYEKEVTTDSSYLYIYGLQDANLNAQQLAVVAGLADWRDVVARAEDESTGYVLPNRALLEIAKQMPLTTSSLHRLVKSKHQYVEQNLNAIVSIIKHSIENAAAFEEVAEHLKKEHMEITSSPNLVVADKSELLSPPDGIARLCAATRPELIGCSYTTPTNLFKHLLVPTQVKEKCVELEHSSHEKGRTQSAGYSQNTADMSSQNVKDGYYLPAHPTGSFTMFEQPSVGNMKFSEPASGAEATVQVLKKPNHAFGALLGNASGKRKFDPGRKEKEDVKLEQIKSSVNLPFSSFLGGVDDSRLIPKEPVKPLEISCHEEPVDLVATNSHFQDMILLNDGSGEKPLNDDPKTVQRNEGNTSGFFWGNDERDESMVSLSDLSSSFKKCFQSANQMENIVKLGKSQDSRVLEQFKPFDHEAARKQVSFGEDRVRNMGKEGDESRRNRREARNKKKSTAVGQSEGGEESGGFQLGRRRQAFPATGNRSATYR